MCVTQAFTPILTPCFAVKKTLKCSLQLKIGCCTIRDKKTFSAFIRTNINSLEYLSSCPMIVCFVGSGYKKKIKQNSSDIYIFIQALYKRGEIQ